MIELYGLTEFSACLGEGWDRRKASVYYKRGKLPEPFAMAGDRPFWTKEQVEEFKERLQSEEE